MARRALQRIIEAKEFGCLDSHGDLVPELPLGNPIDETHKYVVAVRLLHVLQTSTTRIATCQGECAGFATFCANLHGVLKSLQRGSVVFVFLPEVLNTPGEVRLCRHLQVMYMRHATAETGQVRGVYSYGVCRQPLQEVFDINTLFTLCSIFEHRIDGIYADLLLGNFHQCLTQVRQLSDASGTSIPEGSCDNIHHSSRCCVA
mmetsp:Transcript_13242/g.29174  ORF Transcript_13242/g.29174 Transcript_13242/m.29174 type:complete len:203 (-) Transcript_13242:2-610(-)